MGCGAVCGSQSTVAESFKQAQTQFMTLFKQITPNLYLYPVKAIAKFTKQMQLNPQRFHLILTQKLQPKQMITMGVIQKWKLILFGLDCDRPTYVNCLGYPQSSTKMKSSVEKQQKDQAGNEKQGECRQSIEKVEVIQHKAFGQIEKDIDRTFPGIEFQKKSFIMILKRITNHFPTMGYTQGINFIVGYLLIIGFSQSDAFWFFIHMAVNRRYMMLGLYEDGFPLINVYTCIFRNMLKRIKPKLYSHLYQNVAMFEESAWVFKWFMTCFLSSFPIQMCQFVWDMVISLGGIGLVYFAMALVVKLEPQLLEMEDACDISEFLTSLKDLNTFNRYLSIREVVKNAYKMRVENEDLVQLRQVKTQRGGSNFYAQYILFKHDEETSQLTRTPRLERAQLERVSQQLHQTNPILFKKLSGSRSTQILNQWYQKLTKQRQQFHVKSLRKNSFSPSKSNTIIIALDNSQHLVDEPGLPSDVVQLPKQSRISIQNYGSLIRFDVEEGADNVDKPSSRTNKVKIQTEEEVVAKGGQSLQVSPNNKKSSVSRYTNKKFKMQQSIWKDDDEQQQKQENKDKINHLQDQFFYISRDIRFKRKNITYQSQDTLTDMVKKSGKPKQINNNYIPKPAIIRPDSQTTITQQNNLTLTNNNHSRLARVGNAVLSNMSVSNASNKSSASSYRTNHKENPTNVRNCKCMKNKTQENQVETIPKVVSRKNIQRVNQPEEIVQYEQSADFGNARKRMNTYHDWMASSQGPHQNRNLASSNVKQPSQIGSEVQIVQGRQMFKKKNRVAGRIGGEVGIVHECNHATENQISQCQSRVVPTPNLDEESIQSFIIANVSSRRSDLAEIESVK